MARSAHILVRILAGLATIAVVALALLAARLSAGPVSLHALAPSIALLLDAVTPFRFSIGDVGILWRDWERGLLVSLSDVRATAGNNGRMQAQVQILAVSFSPQAMVAGVLAPTSVRATHGQIVFAAAADRIDAEATRDGPTADLKMLLAGLHSGPRPDRPLSYLRDLSLDDLAVTVEDAAALWRTEIAEARFVRMQTSDLSGSAHLTVAGEGGESAAATVTLVPLPADGALRATLEVSDVRPSTFAGLAESLVSLAAVDLPLMGRIEIDVADDGTISQVNAALAGGSGSLSLSSSLLAAAGLSAAAQRLPVQRLSLQGSANPIEDRYTLDSAEVVFAPDAEIVLPAPIDHRYPLASLTASASYTAGRLSVPALNVDTGGPRITASTELNGIPRAPTGNAVVRITELAVDGIKQYWPRTLAPGGYEWCTQHLRDGRIVQARARLGVTSAGGTVQLTSVDGDFTVEGVTVDYLPPMPPAIKAAGSATFDANSLRIRLSSGEVQGLRVRDGVVSIPDLDRDLPTIDINLAINGPVRDAVTLIASEPLAYPQRLGIAPGQTSGDASVRLMLDFPLLAALRTEDMQIEAQVDLKNAAVLGVSEGIDLSDGNVRLDIDTRAMRAGGRISVAGMPGQMQLIESFLENADPQTVLTFESEDIPVNRIRTAVGSVVDLKPYLLDGTTTGRLRVVIGRGVTSIEGNADFEHAKLALPTLQWSKSPGTAGVVEASARMHGGRLEAIPKLSFVAPNLMLEGSAHFDADGDFDHLHVAHFISGKSNVEATLARLPADGWDIMINGSGLDLSPLLTNGETSVTSGTEARAADLPPFTVAADIDNIWLGPDDPFRQVMATIVHDGGLFQLVQMQGNLGNGSEIELSIAPESDKTRVLQLRADDAGEALRAFNLLEDVRGGRLQANGVFDDSNPAHPLAGRLRVKAYHIVGAPILARLLSVLALTGIRDVLTGRGLYFSTLDLPFSIFDGTISIDNGKAYGSALGLTISGSIDTRQDLLDLRGELVPFYAINSAFGRIPLLGEVMTGGEQGGGVFSASYRISGALSEPDISVNPVSVLFPGFMRWILETFEGWVEPGGSAGNGGADSAGQR
jgi:hypothetical protein